MSSFVRHTEVRFGSRHGLLHLCVEVPSVLMRPQVQQSTILGAEAGNSAQVRPFLDENHLMLCSKSFCKLYCMPWLRKHYNGMVCLRLLCFALDIRSIPQYNTSCLHRLNMPSSDHVSTVFSLMVMLMMVPPVNSTLTITYLTPHQSSHMYNLSYSSHQPYFICRNLQNCVQFDFLICLKSDILERGRIQILIWLSPKFM